MPRVSVAAEARSYNVWIESGLLGRAGTLLRRILPHSRRVFVVATPQVNKLCGKELTASLANAGYQYRTLVMPDGERHKRLDTLERLAEQMIAHGGDRDALVVALGGGVTGDVAGMLASVFMRGVDLVQAPTTLLAQVDASVGGKTGVNLKSGKNLLGTFYPPRAVLIDPSVLATLPAREFRAGLYEVVKCGVIGNPALFRMFETRLKQILQRDARTLEKLILESVRLKARIVEEDEREQGMRRWLNFGHTIGHALEAETGYRRLLHGEAVGWGMLAAARIAKSMGMLRGDDAGRIHAGVLGLGGLPGVRVKPGNILKRIQSDKKTRGGKAHFVLPSEIGRVEVVTGVPDGIILKAVEELNELSRKAGGVG
jgi:3-dehydroquinate synthase